MIIARIFRKHELIRFYHFGENDGQSYNFKSYGIKNSMTDSEMKNVLQEKIGQEVETNFL